MLMVHAFLGITTFWIKLRLYKGLEENMWLKKLTKQLKESNMSDSVF